MAAHGLNVTAASRVFFLNACWQKTVERQAIKRAHRIGQTKEVFVETLVLKDTIEVFPPLYRGNGVQEELLKRREEMGRDQLDRTKRFTDDGKMRGIISSAKFMPKYEEDDGEEGFGALFRVKGRKDVDVERELEVCDDDDKVVKKRKVGLDEGKVSKVLDFSLEETSNSKDSRTNKRKRSKLVVLKMPNLDQTSKRGTTKRRRVQFADV